MKLYRSISYKWLLITPFASWGLGFFLNWLVMHVNGGQMPVLMPGGCSADDLDTDAHHVAIWTCMTASSHLKILGDIIYLRAEGIVLSVGDLFQMFSDLVKVPFLSAWIALTIEKVQRG